MPISGMMLVDKSHDDPGFIKRNFAEHDSFESFIESGWTIGDPRFHNRLVLRPEPSRRNIMSLSGLRLLAIGMIVFLAGCATSGTVFTDRDPEQDFSNYKTFAWLGDQPLNIVGDRIISPFIQDKLQNAVKQEMIAKGYSLVTNSDDADIAVGYTVGARDKIRERLLPGRRVVFDPWLYRSDWRWGHVYYDYTFSQPSIEIQEYVEGTLAIDVFDVKRNSPVWHGVANKQLSSKEQNATDGGNIAEAVKTLLKSLPAVN